MAKGTSHKTGRAKPMTPKAGIKKTRYGKGGKLK